MPFKKDTGFSLNKLANVYNTADLGSSIGRQGPGGTKASAEGGILFVDGGNYYHIFKTSGTLVFPEAWDDTTECHYLVVGGGGPNGPTSISDMTGGGGGGGVSVGTNARFFSNNTYAVDMTHPAVSGSNAQNGGTSSLATASDGTITSTGGEWAPRSVGGASGSPQNNAGGQNYPYTGSPSAIVNGGGGGAGGVGTDGGPNTGGDGGPGLACPEFPGPVIAPHLDEPVSVRSAWETAVGPTGLFGGGGGGGTFGNNHVAPGGPGGGGDGGDGMQAGVDYTGGGAGGHYPGTTAPDQRAGGKGIVILKYSL